MCTCVDVSCLHREIYYPRHRKTRSECMVDCAAMRTDIECVRLHVDMLGPQVVPLAEADCQQGLDSDMQ